jgi:DNA (cytosine-5)-methyltransferase 1
MSIGSLFDGSGTAPLAATILGWTPLWASEIEPYPIAVTKARFPNMIHLGDIAQINGAEVVPVDVIVGGSPCQDLSVAGKQAGLQDGSRSHLFYQMTRIVREMRRATNGTHPRFVVWENVPGAFSSNQGRDFHAVIQEFCAIADDAVSIAQPERDPTGQLVWRNAGAIVGRGWSFAWRVLDAQFWGVPQRRRRIFAVLDLGSERAGEILFERTRLPWDSEPRGAEGEGTPADAVGRADRGGGIRCLNPYDANAERIYDGDVAATITGDHQNRVTDYTNLAVFGVDARNAVLNEEITPTLQAKPNGGQSLNCMPPVLYTQERVGQYSDTEVACTQMARQHKSATDLVVQRARCYIVRRLTPTECARLQGFPDWWCDGIAVANPTDEDIAFWTEVWETHRKVMNPEGKPKTRKQIVTWLRDPGSDSNEYKMWGNGMALPCMLAVLNGIDSHARFFLRSESNNREWR